MTIEEEIQSKLIAKFGFLQDKIVSKRARRIFVNVPYENVGQVFEFLVKHMGFGELSSLTGLDNKDTFGIIYHLSRDGKVILNLEVDFAKDKSIQTVTNEFPAADAYERELIDLFGMKIVGLPDGSRYPLPDDWPKDEHPLLKDWKQK